MREEVELAKSDCSCSEEKEAFTEGRVGSDGMRTRTRSKQAEVRVDRRETIRRYQMKFMIIRKFAGVQ
eukprot:717796-Hanusia_phi.AAC.1